jgi:hypothetical protein
MAVGPNEMVDLEFLQDRADGRFAPRARGIGFLERGERAKDSDERAGDEQSRKNAQRARSHAQNNAGKLTHRGAIAGPLRSQNIFLNLAGRSHKVRSKK